MPRVYTIKARKDYPAQGIKKGDTYYAWRVRTRAAGGVDYKSATYPRPSQLNFGFTGRLGDIELDMGNAKDPEELKSFAEALRELGEEQQESYDNLPENFQQSDTGQLLEERAQGLEGWADEVEEAADEWESKLEELNTLREEWVEYHNEHSTWEELSEEEQEAQEEPTEPDEDEPAEDAEDELRSEYVEKATSANPGL